jgi:hypothetical protein
MENQIPSTPEQTLSKGNNRLAVMSGWLGIGSIAFFLVGLAIAFASPASTFRTICMGTGGWAAILGFILGIIGLVQIHRNPGQTGKGMAITGIVIGALFLCVVPILASLLLLTPVVGTVSTQVSGTLVAT